MATPVRLTARILDPQRERRTKHYRGLPPQLTGGTDQREEMGAASLLLIEEDPGGFSLFRFGLDQTCIGDTWHPTLEEAKGQAEYEFVGGVSDWKVVPAEVADPVAFEMDSEELSGRPGTDPTG